MAKQIYWAGQDEAQCRALFEAGFSLTVEPGDSFELADELADALLESSDSWQEGVSKAPTAKELIAGMPAASADELAALAADSRKTVRGAAEQEIASRASATPDQEDAE